MNEEEKKAVQDSKNIINELNNHKDKDFIGRMYYKNKPIEEILEILLNLIEKLQKENKKLREYYEEQNEVNAKFIPIQKTKNKIAELNNLLADIDYKDIEDKQEREFYKKEYYQVVAQIKVLQELLDESEENKCGTN